MRNDRFGMDYSIFTVDQYVFARYVRTCIGVGAALPPLKKSDNLAQEGDHDLEEGMALYYCIP